MRSWSGRRVTCAISRHEWYDISEPMPLRRVLVCCSALLLLGRVRVPGAPMARRMPRPESMATMQLEPGFRIELVAAEPDIQ